MKPDLSKAWEHYSAGRFAEAEADFRDALRTNGKFPDAHRGLGRALARQKKFPEAIEQYSEADKLTRKGAMAERVAILREWGDVFRQQELYPEAAAKYQEALKLDPDNLGIYERYGEFANEVAEKVNFDAAVKLFQEAEEVGRSANAPNRNVLLRRWGAALLEQDRIADAAAKYDEALRIDPDDEDTYNDYDNVASALVEAGRPDEADKIYQEVADVGRKASAANRKVILQRWGASLLERERFSEAAAKYREALDIDPKDSESYGGYTSVAEALVDAQRFGEAEALYQEANTRAQKENPASRKEILRSWGTALLKQDRRDEAAAKYREAQQIDPEDGETYAGYGDVALAFFRAQGRDEADKFYQEAYAEAEKKKAPVRKVILRSWGAALVNQERLDEAAAKYREALGIDPGDGDTYDGYADVADALVDAKRFDDADKLYQDACSRAKTARAAIRAQIRRAWGGSLSARERFDDAAAKYAEALTVYPGDQTTYESFRTLGWVAFRASRFDEASKYYAQASDFQKAGALNAKYALVGWGDALRAEGLPDDAMAKYRDALKADPNFGDAYVGIGMALLEKEDFNDAIDQYDRADKLYADAGPVASSERNFASRYCAYALVGLERFDEAAEKCELAVKRAPEDPWAYFDQANVLSECGRYREAIDCLNEAIRIDPDHPYFRHNKAHFLSQLGNYREGWQAWDEARQRYKGTLYSGPFSTDQVAQAISFADVLREVYLEYAEAEQYYKKALDRHKDNRGAKTGLAILYRQWVDSDAPSPEIQGRVSHAVKQAREALERRSGKVEPFQSLISLADLHIETQDWSAARHYLESARAICGPSSLRRANIAARSGLIEFRTERYSKAVEHFREALLQRPADMTVRSNMGKALLRLKKFEAAEAEFTRVLKNAEGHIDARLGIAQLCIELADGGDHDRYRMAEEHLTAAIEFGRNKEAGSKRLRGSELANVFYLRGYASVKRYENDTVLGRLGTSSRALRAALNDFRQCKAEDQNHRKATAAIEQLTRQSGRQGGETAIEAWSPLIVGVTSFVVLLIAQLDYLFGKSVRAWLGDGSDKVITDDKTYVIMTFGALLFMVAGFYLPKVLKLKVGGIELQKASVEQVSAPSTLDIGRFSTTLKG